MKEIGQLTSASGSRSLSSFELGITIEIFRYCTCASVYIDEADDGELVLLNMACNDQPSPFVYFGKVLELYAVSTKGSPSPAPMTREELASEYSVKMEFVSKKTGRTDIDKISWRRNGLGVYVWSGVRAVKNFLMHLVDVLS